VADELDIEQPRPGQHHHEAPVPVPLAVRGDEREMPEVDLRLLAGLGFKAHGRFHGPARSSRSKTTQFSTPAARRRRT
jgi:hypothetical protein